MADGSEDDPVSLGGRYLWDIHRKYPVARIQCLQLVCANLWYIPSFFQYMSYVTNRIDISTKCVISHLHHMFSNRLSYQEAEGMLVKELCENVKPLDIFQEISGHLQQNMIFS